MSRATESDAELIAAIMAAEASAINGCPTTTDIAAESALCHSAVQDRLETLESEGRLTRSLSSVAGQPGTVMTVISVGGDDL